MVLGLAMVLVGAESPMLLIYKYNYWVAPLFELTSR
jgi:hypothetical protein